MSRERERCLPPSRTIIILELDTKKAIQQRASSLKVKLRNEHQNMTVKSLIIA